MFRLKVDDEINLVLLNERLAPVLAKIVTENMEYLSQWLEWPRHCHKEDDYKAFIKSTLHDYADGKCMGCAIEYNGTIVGVTGFNTIDWDLSKAEIGYWIAADYQRKGIMTRVCQALINYAFDELGLGAVKIAAATGNAASRAVCERLGMTLEGILSHSEKVNGQLLDHAVYVCHKLNDK